MNDRNPAAARRLAARSRFLWTVAPPVLRGVGRSLFSLEVEQETPLPDPPFVLAANHYSHLDPPAIAAALDIPIRYLALEDLFVANRLLDWLITGFGAIPTPRFRVPIGAVRTALGALDSGEVVGVFPEATRVTHWGTLPPKRGAAWLATRSGVPLVPVAIVGTGQALGLENKVHRAPIRVISGPPVAVGDIDEMTSVWAAWMTTQIGRFPASEVDGPRRAEFDPSMRP
ncbi:MAG: lysophospholipid acyltransferase family protein [Acidimicrobiia bacterium]